jgi:hypothetical protein
MASLRHQGSKDDPSAHAESLHEEIAQSCMPASCPKLHRLQPRNRNDPNKQYDQPMTGIAQPEHQPQNGKCQNVIKVVSDRGVGTKLAGCKGEDCGCNDKQPTRPPSDLLDHVEKRHAGTTFSSWSGAEHSIIRESSSSTGWCADRSPGSCKIRLPAAAHRGRRPSCHGPVHPLRRSSSKRARRPSAAPPHG